MKLISTIAITGLIISVSVALLIPVVLFAHDSTEEPHEEQTPVEEIIDDNRTSQINDRITDVKEYEQLGLVMLLVEAVLVMVIVSGLLAIACYNSKKPKSKLKKLVKK